MSEQLAEYRDLNVTLLLENTIAITESFVADSRHSYFYNSNVDYFQGSTGIYRWLSAAATQFTRAERGVLWDGEWIDHIEKFVSDVLYADDSHLYGAAEFLQLATQLLAALPRDENIPKPPPSVVASPVKVVHQRTRVIDLEP